MRLQSHNNGRYRAPSKAIHYDTMNAPRDVPVYSTASDLLVFSVSIHSTRQSSFYVPVATDGQEVIFDIRAL